MDKLTHIFQTWLTRFTRREQIMLLLGGAMLFFALVYFALLYPMQQSLLAAESKFLASEGRYNRVAAQLKNITPQQQKTGQASIVTTPDIRSAVIKVAGALQITLTRIQLERSGSIAVWLDQIESPRFYSFMQRLEADYAVVADQVTMQMMKSPDQPSSGPDALRVQLSLRYKK